MQQRSWTRTFVQDKIFVTLVGLGNLFVTQSYSCYATFEFEFRKDFNTAPKFLTTSIENIMDVRKGKAIRQTSQNIVRNGCGIAWFFLPDKKHKFTIAVGDSPVKLRTKLFEYNFSANM